MPKQDVPAVASDDYRYRQLVEAITDYAIYMLDPTGIVASWNPGAERFKGYTAQEIIGQHFSRFYTPEDREDGLPERALRTAETEGRFVGEGWRVRKDGTRFWAAVVIDPIRTPKGVLVGFAKITRDLTERKEAEEQLRQTREALFQAQKVEAVGKLTGGVAHDFNNLLMAILSSLELMKKRMPDDNRFRMMHSNAVEAAQRGVALTQRMLAFARRQALTVETIDIGSVLHGVTPLLESALGPSVHLDIRRPHHLPAIKADANQLETSLLNLVVNARDAMPHGGTITITARGDVLGESDATRKPGKYVVISVTDTGEGMDPATLRRAVEPFFTTKSVGKGTGLGLSMVQGMAEQLGGSMDIKSVRGKGTTVEIWLPQAPDQEVTADEASYLASRKVILVVDDDRLVRVNTAAMLEEMGIATLEAASGVEALQVLRTSPDVVLVLTDHVMPQMTGGELAQQLRVERPDLPVIIATGYASLLAEDKGLVAQLKKPFSMKDLEQAVSPYLRTL